jgi:hypothetical protein
VRRREFIVGLGGAATWPLVAASAAAGCSSNRYINAGTDDAIRSLTAAFRQGLGEFGYVEVPLHCGLFDHAIGAG